MIARIPQTGFVRSPVNEFVKAENQKVVVQVLIESSLGVENIDSIAAVEGVDIIAVGANDLTAEMGCPGQVREPAVIAAFERIAAAAHRYGQIAVDGGIQGHQKSEERCVGKGGGGECDIRGSTSR